MNPIGHGFTRDGIASDFIGLGSGLFFVNPYG